MSEEQIRNLLLQSGNHFLKRELDVAMQTAEKALELSTADTYTRGIVQSNLLLGKIYTTSGRFKAKGRFISDSTQLYQTG